MVTSERRKAIMRILYVQKYETIPNLAGKLGVSERTVQRDIDILSITEPIYTKCCRYEGGVYMTDNYAISRIYMSDSELSVLHKLVLFAENKIVCDLNGDELKTLNMIISQHAKPK